MFVFGRLQTLKIELPPRREHDFYKIDVFKIGRKNVGFGRHFGKPKRSKINKNMHSKTYVFLAFIFWDFFAILAVFWEAENFTAKQCRSKKFGQDTVIVGRIICSSSLRFFRCHFLRQFSFVFGRPQTLKIDLHDLGAHWSPGRLLGTILVSFWVDVGWIMGGLSGF